MLSSDLETSLNVAIQSAREAVHEFITVEHLLLALLDNPSASRAIRACGGDLDRLQEELNSFLDQHVPLIPEDSRRGSAARSWVPAGHSTGNSSRTKLRQEGSQR